MTLNLEEIKVLIKREDIKIKMKLSASSYSVELATATLSLGPFNIGGFRIQKSEFKNRSGEYLWVQPPSYRDKKGQWHKIFWIENVVLWNQVEDMMLQRYNALLMEKDIKNQVSEIEGQISSFKKKLHSHQ